MGWGCPHQIGEYCKRLKVECQPGRKGCVLGKANFIKVNEEKQMPEIDLRQIMPFERHELIFQKWEAMKSGEVLKLINDHDPKPLHYQFEAEYKNQYKWEYIQNGPKDWVVNIKKV